MRYNRGVDRTRLILFLASGRSNLHLMAEALARRVAPERVEIISANMGPAELDPAAAAVMTEAGLDLSAIPSRSPLDVELFTFDLVVTLGDFDQSCRPNLPGMPPHLHWDFPQARPGDSPLRATQILRDTRDQLSQRVDALIASGVLHALFVTRRNFELIVDNLGEGVIAHAASRRIFYFNQAAERMTGMRREDVLGRDCHEVFQGRLCGPACAMCAGDDPAQPRGARDTVLFVRSDGEERTLEKVSSPLADLDGQHVGGLVSLKDITELDTLKRRLKHHHALGGMIGKDTKMLALFDLIREVASVNVPVLVEGESGTGKELVARAIHSHSLRKDRPFVPINCSTIPETMIETELFGHLKGSFTGALRDKKGLVEEASQGTLFLDEIGDLSLTLQVKLLRLIQEGEYKVIGSNTLRKVDIRLIAATHQPLVEKIKKGEFREDLYYRLNVINIHLPPLRERRTDIPLLCRHFLQKYAVLHAKKVNGFSARAMDYLMKGDWPGNVREIENTVERGVIMAMGDVVDLPDVLGLKQSTETGSSGLVGPTIAADEIFTMPFKEAKDKLMEEFQTQYISKILAKHSGNVSQAARESGLKRQYLHRLMRDTQVDSKSFKKTDSTD